VIVSPCSPGRPATPPLSFALLLSFVLSTGCGDGTGVPPTPGDGGGRPSATNGSPPFSSPAGAGHLQRHDVPPAGVQEQLFGVFAHPAPPCSDADSEGPAVIASSTAIEIPGGKLICLPGFAIDHPILVDVEQPDGVTREERIGLSLSIPYLVWYAVPGDPNGEYRVIARQGANEATGSFRVAEARSPGLLLLPPDRAPPGTTFRMALGGFPAKSSVDIYVYIAQPEKSRWAFFAALPPAVLDERGDGFYEITTSADDPDGEYCVTYRAKGEPAHDECDDFFTVAS
jgi:hypothetical protein